MVSQQPWSSLTRSGPPWLWSFSTVSTPSTGSTRNPFILLLVYSLSSPWSTLQTEAFTAGSNPLIWQIQPDLCGLRWQDPGPAHKDTARWVRKDFLPALSGPLYCIILGSAINAVVTCCSILDRHGGLRSYCVPCHQRWPSGGWETKKL